MAELSTAEMLDAIHKSELAPVAGQPESDPDKMTTAQMLDAIHKSETPPFAPSAQPQSFMEGAKENVQGLLTGFNKEAYGGYSPEARYYMSRAIGGSPEQAQGAESEERQKMRSAESKTPWSYGIGRGLGFLVSMGALGKAASAARIGEGLGTVAKGASEGAATMGAMGALESQKGKNAKPEDTQWSAENMKERLIRGAKNALGGAVMGGLSGYVSKLISPDKLNKLAQDKAVRVFDPKGNALKNIVSNTSGEGQTIERLGQTAIDEGLMKATNAGDLLQMVGDASETRGAAIGENIKAMDATGAKMALKKSDLFKSISEMLAPIKSGVGGGKAYTRVMSDVANTLNGYSDSMTPGEVQAVKTSIGRLINFKKPWPDMNNVEKANNAIYHGLKDGLEAVADNAVKSGIVHPQLASEYMANKAAYQDLKTLWGLASSKANRAVNNRIISPTDYAAGIIGAAASHNPIGAITTGALNHVGRKFGNQTMALGTNALANSPKVLGAAGLLGKGAKAGTGLLMNQATERTK